MSVLQLFSKIKFLKTQKYEKMFNITLRNTNKICKLISNELPYNVNTNKSSWLVKVSNIQILITITEILATHKTFALPIIEKKVFRVHWGIETAIDDKSANKR